MRQLLVPDHQSGFAPPDAISCGPLVLHIAAAVYVVATPRSVASRAPTPAAARATVRHSNVLVEVGPVQRSEIKLGKDSVKLGKSV